MKRRDWSGDCRGARGGENLHIHGRRQQEVSYLHMHTALCGDVGSMMATERCEVLISSTRGN